MGLFAGIVGSLAGAVIGGAVKGAIAYKSTKEKVSAYQSAASNVKDAAEKKLKETRKKIEDEWPKLSYRVLSLQLHTV